MAVLLMLCGFSKPLVAAEVPLRPVQRQVWTTEDGLPQNSVHAILQTTDGYLWLATESGLARFDGVRFSTYSTGTDKAFSSNDVCCLVQTGGGVLWIGTSDGVLRYSGDRFERFRGVSGTVLQMAAGRDGSLLVLTSEGLVRVHGHDATALTLPGGAEVTGLGTDGAGRALVIAGRSVWTDERDGMVLRRTLPVQPLELVEGADRRVWVRTRTEVMLLSQDGERHFLLGKELPGTRLESISRTRDGVVAGTNQGAFGLRVDAPGLVATSARVEPSGRVDPIVELAGSAVLCAYVDAEGDWWFGTDSSGLIVLRARAFGSVPGLRSETVTSVMEAGDGTLWVGTRDSGVRLVRGGEVVRPAFKGSLASDVILSLAPGDRDGAWVGTPEGLDQISGGVVRHLSSADGLPDDFVRSLLTDRDGSLWVGTRRGMAHLVDGRVVKVWTVADGLPSEVIGTMLRAADGDLWIGTLRGLARLRDDRLQKFGAAEGVRGTVITALAQTPDGVLWVGAKDGGLSAGRGGRFMAFRAEALRGQINALVPDDRGGLWIRNAAGVARAGVAELEACESHAGCEVNLRQYGTADGMPSVDASSDGHPSAWRSRSGMLWFATRRGLAVVDAASYARDAVPPPVVIEQFLVDDQPMPLPDGTIRVGPGHRRFNIGYAGLSFASPSQVLYRFKLQGFDRDWVEAGNRRSVEYTNLPPGSYRLLVEARNADGVRSSWPAELAFAIEPPLYRRWWFYALLLMLLAAVVYGAYRLRLGTVEHEFAAVLQERNRIAREIHDTLAQDFVAVSLQLEVTSQLLKQSNLEAAREQVDTARQLVRDGIREARESIWALRANTAAESLPAQLKAMTEQKRTEGMEARFAVTGAYRALPSHVEKELLRVAKEAFGNAARHSGATHILVDIVYLEDAVKLQVRDDGAGFDLEEGNARAGHYGLRGMRERAKAVGGSLELQSVRGEGTSVTLILRC